MATISRAEQGLLESLGKERVLNQGKTNKFGTLTTMKLDMTNITPISKLKRPESLEELARQKEEVAALPGKQQAVPSREHSEGFKKIIQKDLEKRDRHNKALKDYESKVVIISEELEKKLIAQSHAAVEAIEQVDIQIQKALDDLREPEVLVKRSYQYVQDAWATVSKLLRERTEAVSGFASVLEGVEKERADTVGAELREMVDLMIKIGHKLPDDMERIAAQEAYELNSILISNRLIMHEMMARLESRDCEMAHWAQREWEGRLDHWRQLRHEKALADFRDALNAPNFKNPNERQNLLARVRLGQRARHQRRQDLIRELGQRKVPELEPHHVETTQKHFLDLQAEEEAAEEEVERELESIREDKVAEAKGLREALRMELHDYGALEQEPDLENPAAFYEDLLSDHSNDDFFRKAGGLKSELKTLIQELLSPDLNYFSALDSAIQRNRVLVCGLDLEDILEKQGKAQNRRSLKEMVERLRKGGKADVLPLLPSFMQQTSELSKISDLDPLFRETLQQCAEDLEELTEDVDFKSLGGKSKPMSQKRRSSKGSLALSRQPSNISKGSRGSFKSKRTSKSKGGLGASSIATNVWDTVDIDFAGVRAVQRKVGMLVSTCELQPEVKEMLRDTLDSLSQKARCNKAIDKVVGKESEELLQARDEEFTDLSTDILRALDIRAFHLHNVSEQLCGFFLTSAKIVHAHLKFEEEVDEASMDEMFDLKEEFRIETHDREEALAASLDRVRKAADEAELEQSFERSLGMLEEIEASYRIYHNSATEAAERHPVAVKTENSRFETSVCGILSLEVYIPPPIEEASLGSLESGEHGFSDDDSLVSRRSIGSRKSRGSKTRSRSPSKVPKAKSRMGGSRSPSRVNSRASTRTSTTKKSRRKKNTVEDLEPKIELLVPEEPLIPRWKATSGLKEYIENKKIPELAEGLLREMDPEEKEAKDKEQNAQKDSEKAVDDAEKAPEEEEEEDAPPEPVEPWWASGFIPLSEEEFEGLEEVAKEEYIDKKDAAFIELSEEKLDEVLPVSGIKDKKLIAANEAKRREYEPVAAEIMAIRQVKAEEAARIQAEKDAIAHKQRLSYIPEDIDGERCIEPVEVSPDLVVGFLTEFRDSLVSWMEGHEAMRTKKADDLCEERKDFLTEELEDRLRGHWPRKGRAEVSCRAPREGELVTHMNRAQRYAHGLLEKHEAQEQAFLQLVHQAQGLCDKFVMDLAQLKATLPDHNSIAALQGVDTRQRKLVALFEQDFEGFVDHLSSYLTVEPEGLLQGCEVMINQCKTFDEGGDYDETEIEFLRENLEEPRELIRSAVEERKSRLEELEEQKLQSLGGLGVYREKYAKATLELSLREGLGQKYGAPRRNAQEQLRTEITRDEAAANLIDTMLDSLESLCAEAKKLYLTRQTPREVKMQMKKQKKQEEGPHLSARILSCLLSLRVALFNRASYLQYLRNPDGMNLTDLPGSEDIVLEEGVHLLPQGTFEGSIDALEKQCKEETKELYKREKREELLGEDGIPESLKLWLEESRAKALGADGHYYGSCHRLRGQVVRFEYLVAKRPVPPDPEMLAAPCACLTDLLHRFKNGARTMREESEAAFSKMLSVWEAARKKHEFNLRPQLGNPDKAAELQKLVDIEESRQEEVKEALQKFLADILESENSRLRHYCEEMVSMVILLLKALDTVLMADHLGRLPGEEIEPTKRKNLKRLRKAKRQGKGPEEGQPLVADDADDFVKKWEYRQWKPLDLSKVENPEIQEQLEIIREALFESFVTTSHREVIRRRDSMFTEYLEYFCQSVSELQEKYTNLVQAEEAWGLNWKTMYTKLQRVNET